VEPAAADPAAVRVAVLAESTPVRQSERAVSGTNPPPAQFHIDASSDDVAPDDQQLRVWMTAYQAGRLDGFDQLYGAVAPPLRRYLIMLTRDAVIADDLLQEAFLQVHRSRHTYDPDQPLRPWVFAIARHVYLMNSRATRRRLARVGAMPDDLDMPVPPEVDALADRMLVRSALEQIGPDRREALLLHHLWGFSFREIAGILGITGAAAKLRSSRGMADLRYLIGDDGRERTDG
jgi:RNA polymerase sigma-70 factor (ECF subfamily)